MPGQVEAQYFNVAQTALKRVDDQWRFKIPGLNHLDLILQEDAWIVVDRVLNDMPVAAWTNFQIEGRDPQFIHIPSVNEVKEQIAIAGFALVYCEYSGNIVKEPKGRRNTMFYVCRKAPKVI